MAELLGKYGFWLIWISIFLFLLERFFPWRDQKLLRKEILQDLFWLVFNGYFLGILLNPMLYIVYGVFDTGFFIFFPEVRIYPRFLENLPLWLQVTVFLIYTDFFEWCIHNLLHRIGFLWRFHRVHHSIVVMDWIGNFRFHWMEMIVYNSLKYIPLSLAGGSPEALLITAVISTLVGHFNHANLHITWGSFRYIFNSPGMHIWHHDRKLRGKGGVNFAVVFSMWDWIFHTAYMPDHGQPERLGFAGDQNFPKGILHRFFIPFLNPPVSKSSL